MYIFTRAGGADFSPSGLLLILNSKGAKFPYEGGLN